MNISNHNAENKNPGKIPPVEKPHDVVKTPEDAVKEPLTPVPVIDDIKPPLEATLGGDDLLVPGKKER